MQPPQYLPSKVTKFIAWAFILFFVASSIGITGIITDSQVALAGNTYTVGISTTSATAGTATALTFSTTIPTGSTLLKKAVLHIPNGYQIADQLPNPLGSLNINIPDSGTTLTRDLASGVQSTLMSTLNTKYSYLLTLDKSARTLTVVLSVTALPGGAEIAPPSLPDTVEISVALNEGVLTNPSTNGTYTWNVEGLGASNSNVTLSAPTTTITGGTSVPPVTDPTTDPTTGVVVTPSTPPVTPVVPVAPSTPVALNPPVLEINPTPEQTKLAQLPDAMATVSPTADQATALKTGDGLVITVLKGALANQTDPYTMQVSIGAITTPPQDSSGVIALDPVKYERNFSIEGLAEGTALFNSPVTVTFPFSLSDLPANTNVDQLAVFWWHPIKKNWVKLGGVVDKINNTITMPLYHFSTYAIMADTSNVPARLAGTDRFGTANAVAEEGWKTGADSVVLVNAYSFPDALAATPLAFKNNAPILLTDTNNLTSATAAELQKLAPNHIYIIGSTGVISQSIEDNLQGEYGQQNVVRYGGADRYATAAVIAGALGTTGKAIIGSGDDAHFADSLAMSSFAAYQGIPVLFSRQDALPAATQEALIQQKVTTTYVAGSEGAISANVMALLPGANRYGGADRYDTAVKIATGLQMNAQHVYIVTGVDFPDALVASNLAAHSFSPLIMVEQGIPDSTASYLRACKGSGTTLTVIGGAGVVSSAQEGDLQTIVK